MIRTISLGALQPYPKPSITTLLPMSSTIYSLASKHITSGLNMYPQLVAIMVNTELPEGQKLYLEELLQAAALIDNQYRSKGFTFDNMAYVFENELVGRIVPPTACPPTKTLDPVSRACVNILPDIKSCPSGTILDSMNNCVPIVVCTADQTYDSVSGKCIDKSTTASLFSGNMVYILIGAVALLLLMGRKS